MRIKQLGVVLVIVSVAIAAVPVFAARGEPDQVVVQHILIGFKHSVPGKELERSRKEARALAEHLLARALEGEDFDALVKEYTDDVYPGTMLLTNKGVNPVPGGTKRGDVVARFGDISFRLEVGAIEMAKHHAALSPYGWHLIKRLE